VEIPQHRMTSLDDIAQLPVMPTGEARPLLGELATLSTGMTPGQIERYNMQRVVSLTANLHGVPLGNAARQVQQAIDRVGPPPKGSTVNVRGQIPPLRETVTGLQFGLALSVAAIFLLLAAAFQSLRLALAVIATVPAVLLGVVGMLLVTGTTLNVQSFLGAIMAIGIAVANSILFVTFAERARLEGVSAGSAAVQGGQDRVRAIVMTATAMIAGMVPIALGLGEGSQQTVPLGRAVIGGLLAATMTTLLVLPALYALLQRRASTHSLSLDPTDPGSRYFDVERQRA
jgi:multidrug efflux pump subunit AcrB